MTAGVRPAFPTVPRDRLERGGWEPTDESVETLFRLPGLTVRGATLAFHDRATADAVAEFAAVDRPLRVFAATALSFDPSLPPVASRRILLPTVRAKATDRFRATLRDRGLLDVRRAGVEQIRLDAGEPVRLTRFRAMLPVDGPSDPVPVVAWLGVWYAHGFRIASGAYPARRLGDVLRLAEPPPVLSRTADDYRDELFGLIAAVE